LACITIECHAFPATAVFIPTPWCLCWLADRIGGAAFNGFVWQRSLYVDVVVLKTGMIFTASEEWPDV